MLPSPGYCRANAIRPFAPGNVARAVSAAPAAIARPTAATAAMMTFMGPASPRCDEADARTRVLRPGGRAVRNRVERVKGSGELAARRTARTAAARDDGAAGAPQRVRRVADRGADDRVHGRRRRARGRARGRGHLVLG